MEVVASTHKPQSHLSVVHGNILDVSADYLVSSGNPWLNMSGGVNGALRERYGDVLQTELHDYLKEIGLKAVPAGFCYKWKQQIGNYKGVVYAVGIDPFYDSSKEMISQTLMTAFNLLAPKANETVVFPAIGTGFGHLSKPDFAAALRNLSAELLKQYPGSGFRLVERNNFEAEDIAKVLEHG